MNYRDYVLNKFSKINFLLALTYVLYSPLTLAVNCGDSITHDVTLKEDLDCSSHSFAFGVFANNVTIDLNGHTLSGSLETRGITIRNFDGLVVKNGVIRGFSMALNTTRSDRLSVRDVTFYENSAAIIISGGNHARIADNDFIRSGGNSISINVYRKDDTAFENIITNNEFYQVRLHAVRICGVNAERNTIADNLVWKSASSAFMLIHADFNQLYRNRTIESPNFTAITLNSSSYNIIQSNGSVMDNTVV